VIAWAAVVVRSLEPVEHRKALHIELERIAAGVAGPIVVVHKAIEADHSTAGVAGPIVVVRKVIEVVHSAVGVADSHLVAEVGLDHYS